MLLAGSAQFNPAKIEKTHMRQILAKNAQMFCAKIVKLDCYSIRLLLGQAITQLANLQFHRTNLQFHRTNLQRQRANLQRQRNDLHRPTRCKLAHWRCKSARWCYKLARWRCKLAR